MTFDRFTKELFQYVEWDEARNLYDKFVEVTIDSYFGYVFDIEIVSVEDAAEIILNGKPNPTKRGLRADISMVSKFYPTLVDEIEVQYVNVNGTLYECDYYDSYKDLRDLIIDIINENDLSYEDAEELVDVMGV